MAAMISLKSTFSSTNFSASGVDRMMSMYRISISFVVVEGPRHSRPGWPSQLRRTVTPRYRHGVKRILRRILLALCEDGQMAADLAFFGTVLTVDDAQPTAEALAVADGRVVAVGSRADVEGWIGPDTEVVELGDGCVMPGLVEAHGHPLMEAVVLSDRMVDIRPVTMRSADDVVAAIHHEVDARGESGAYLNGWDPLLQVGLPEPTLDWLDLVAPATPLVIIHNSGHKAYFNSAAARQAGLTRDT